MPGDAWVGPALDALRGQGLGRETVARAGAGGAWTGPGGRRVLNFASNDYLDLARDPRVVEGAVRAARAAGAGAASSRLMAGTLALHERLEARLAGLKGYPSALLFGSGFLANAGLVPALVGRGDHVFADRLAHASLIDGIRLSGARHHRFRHNDAGHLEEQLAAAPPGARKLVVTESVFSMEGDLAPLADLARAAAGAGAMLLVDEAHATGVFGPGGGGLVRDAGLEDRVTLSMGTLSKALGGYGGFAACAAAMREWLVHRARAFIYTTAPPPAAAGAALAALDVLAAEPGRGPELLRRAAAFRARLEAGGLDTRPSGSQVVPVQVGDSRRAVALARRLEAQGLLVVAVRPPTVPPGRARLRLSVTLAHAPDELDRAAAAIAAAAREEGLV